MAERLIDKIKSGIDEYLREQDRLYPDRHKEIHKTSCKNCPSEQVEDPEVRQIKDTCSKEVIAKEFAFVCAWRKSKLCKGYCDYNGIDQEFLDNLYKDDK